MFLQRPENFLSMVCKPDAPKSLKTPDQREEEGLLTELAINISANHRHTDTQTQSCSPANDMFMPCPVPTIFMSLYLASNQSKYTKMDLHVKMLPLEDKIRR